MNTLDNSGAAFPHPTEPGYWPGLTLRDWFAGMALQGLLSNPDIKHGGDVRICGALVPFDRAAWIFADAMLKAREVKP